MSDEKEVETEKVHIKIKRWENVVMLKVLKSPEDFVDVGIGELPFYVATNGFEVRSSQQPSITSSNGMHGMGGGYAPNGIQVWGTMKNKRNKVCTFMFKTSMLAKNWVEEAEEGIKDWAKNYGNQTHEDENVVETEIKG